MHKSLLFSSMAVGFLPAVLSEPIPSIHLSVDSELAAPTYGHIPSRGNSTDHAYSQLLQLLHDIYGSDIGSVIQDPQWLSRICNEVCGGSEHACQQACSPKQVAYPDVRRIFVCATSCEHYPHDKEDYLQHEYGDCLMSCLVGEDQNKTAPSSTATFPLSATLINSHITSIVEIIQSPTETGTHDVLDPTAAEEQHIPEPSVNEEQAPESSATVEEQVPEPSPVPEDNGTLPDTGNPDGGEGQGDIRPSDVPEGTDDILYGPPMKIGAPDYSSPDYVPTTPDVDVEIYNFSQPAVFSVMLGDDGLPSMTLSSQAYESTGGPFTNFSVVSPNRTVETTLKSSSSVSGPSNSVTPTIGDVELVDGASVPQPQVVLGTSGSILLAIVIGFGLVLG